jgi:hypothetical protein
VLVKRYPGLIPIVFLLVVAAVWGAEGDLPTPAHPEATSWPLEHILIKQSPGATYSPTVAFLSNEAYPGLASLCWTLDVSPDEAVTYSGTVRDLADVLARKGVGEDELGSAQAQFAAAMKGWMTDNNFWLNDVLADAQENLHRLDDARSAMADIHETTVADLNTLARRYLHAQQVFRYVIDPTARLPKKK